MPKTANNCCCPAPPCLSSLCVSALIGPSGSYLAKGSTIRFQGPGGIDTSVTLDCDHFQACYANPPAGSWTITVSHPCGTTTSVVRTVAACVSQSFSVNMPFRFTTVSYSDGLSSGSTTFSTAGFTIPVAFSSDHVCVDCDPDVGANAVGPDTVHVVVRCESFGFNGCDAFFLGLSRIGEIVRCPSVCGSGSLVDAWAAVPTATVLVASSVLTLGCDGVVSATWTPAGTYDDVPAGEIAPSFTLTFS